MSLYNLPCVTCGKKYALHSSEDFFDCFSKKLEQISNISKEEVQ